MLRIPEKTFNLAVIAVTVFLDKITKQYTYVEAA
jgi:hypothetical protein